MPSQSVVEVGSVRIECLAEGAGDPVVLIPGGGIGASYFAGLAGRIARAGFHAIAITPAGLAQVLARSRA